MKGMVVRRLLALLVFISFAACSRPPAAKRYELQGRVVAVDSGARELTIAHKDIPGYMEAMTMPYTVSDKDSWVLKSIAPGDQIHATLVLGGRAELQDITFTRSSEPVTDGNPALRIPQPGDEVPDVALVNQNGKTIHFQQFRGKPLLLTFIYTRCPFPDYCPRMTRQFAEVDRQLRANPALDSKTHLLSISFDPQHDRPKVLREYGFQSLGSRQPSVFDHWEFAVPPAAQLAKMTNFFGLTYTADGEVLNHSLSTAVIGPDGRTFSWYHGNEWQASDLVKDVAEAIRSGS